MCSDKVILFGQQSLPIEDVTGRSVLEVGARVVQNPSMTLRHYVTSLGPRSYLGIDIEDGYGVDEICAAENAVERFGAESFDVVIATELLEHVREWWIVVSVLKQLVRRGGVLLVTTRSEGFPYHAWPHDYWRYSLDDFKRIFADMRIERLKPDPKEPGVFMLARKPDGFVEHTEHFPLYSMIARGRALQVGKLRERTFVTMMGARRAYQRRVPEPARMRVNRALHRRRATGITGS